MTAMAFDAEMQRLIEQQKGASTPPSRDPELEAARAQYATELRDVLEATVRFLAERCPPEKAVHYRGGIFSPRELRRPEGWSLTADDVLTPEGKVYRTNTHKEPHVVFAPELLLAGLPVGLANITMYVSHRSDTGEVELGASSPIHHEIHPDSSGGFAGVFARAAADYVTKRGARL